MSRLTYSLQFIRPAGTPKGKPAVASSISITTAITPGGVTGTIETLPQYGRAWLDAKPTLHHPDGSFTETGTITFGKISGNDQLSFSSIGLGYMNAYDCPETIYTAGTVMWKIDSGRGYFAGATGAITSNFLINLKTNELIAYQFGVVYVP